MLFHWTGIRRLSSWWQRITGKQCDCKGRQLTLNRWHERVIRWAFQKRGWL
jgi:hypothetical protein